MEKFPNVAAVIAEKEVRMSGLCRFCGKDAAFNVKISGDMNSILDVGSDEKYKTVCRKCHIRESAKADP